MTVSKDQSIIMQVCAKIASELTPKGDDVNTNIVRFQDAYEAVCEIILTSQGMTNQPAPAPQPVVQQSYNPAPNPAESASDEATFMHAFPSATGFTVRIKGKQHGPIPEWLNEQCAMKGVTEVWDNRDGLASNPKRPWFKSTSTNDAFWEPKRK